MQFDPPSWHSTQDCPDCDQLVLAFITCPACGLVVFVCDEIGCVYRIADVKCGEFIGQHGEAFVCPQCSVTKLVEFRDAASEEIRALGFRVGDYF